MSARYWVVLPAAGIGSRFKSLQPKQYYQLHNKSILAHTLDRFLPQRWVHQVVLALSPEDTHFSSLGIDAPDLRLVVGGKTRSETVLLALKSLSNQAQAQDWVLVHDVVRPCVHPDDLEKMVSQLSNDPIGGILATKLHDTLKSVEGNTIQRTLDRTPLWRATTPQMFRYGKLLQALSLAIAQNDDITDESSAIERMGEHPKIVEAIYPNPKLTTQNDLSYISQLLLEPILSEEIG